MSIAELRERLCLLKEKEEAKEAERRKEIHQAKHRQELRLNEAKRKIEGINFSSIIGFIQPGDGFSGDSCCH